MFNGWSLRLHPSLKLLELLDKNYWDCLNAWWVGNDQWYDAAWFLNNFITDSTNIIFWMCMYWSYSQNWPPLILSLYWPSWHPCSQGRSYCCSSLTCTFDKHLCLCRSCSNRHIFCRDTSELSERGPHYIPTDWWRHPHLLQIYSYISPPLCQPSDTNWLEIRIASGWSLCVCSSLSLDCGENLPLDQRRVLE